MSDKVREQYDNRPFIEWWNAPPSKPPQMVAFALNVWAASRAAALEEAAKAMDERAAFYQQQGRVGRADDFSQASVVIRALLAPPAGGSR